MNQSIENAIMFDDTVVIAKQSGTNGFHFGDCDNNPTHANDILFNDLEMIQTKHGQSYLQASVTNANCDCGR